MTERELGALQIVNRHSLYAGGVGLIPLPIVDMLGTMAVQVHMLSDLSKHYDIPFAANRVKSLLTALIGGIVPGGLASGIVAPLVGAIPVVGGVLSGFALPATQAAVTLAAGKVFIQHFESGGTFLDFDPEKVRDHFKQEFGKARGSSAA
ncbi:MAG: YcjF family protein [Vicinamibacterales bacterium]